MDRAWEKEPTAKEAAELRAEIKSAACLLPARRASARICSDTGREMGLSNN